MSIDLSSEYTYTVEQFIKSEDSTKLDYNSLAIFQKVNSIYMITHNVINDYMPELKAMCGTVVMSDLEYLKYKQKPKLLAYDCYGSTELYFLILKLNNMYDVKQFDKKSLKMIKKKKLSEVLSYIYEAQNGIITANRMKLE